MASKQKKTRKVVNYKDINLDLIYVTAPKPGVSLNKANSFFRMEILYKHEGVDSPIEDAGPLIIEGPEMQSDFGLMNITPKDGGENAKSMDAMLARYEEANQEHMDYYDISEKIYFKILDAWILHGKKHLKRPTPISIEEAEGKFAFFIKVEKDPDTYIPNKDGAVQWFKCVNYMYEGKTIKTKFFDIVDRNQMEWSTLRDTGVKFMPCLTIKYVHIGAICSITTSMGDCLITGFYKSPPRIGFKQEATATRIVAERGEEYVDQFKKDLASLTSRREDKTLILNPGTSVSLPIKKDSDDPNENGEANDQLSTILEEVTYED